MTISLELVNLIRIMITRPILGRRILLESPRFCSWFPGYFKNLPEKYPSRRYAKLHVILRANDSVMNTNTSRQLEKIGLLTKLDVIRISTQSLAAASLKFGQDFGFQNIAITVVCDRLSASARNMIAGFFTNSQGKEHQLMPVTFVSSKPGNAPTFKTQIAIASEDSPDTLVAICEDDYLYDENVFTTAFQLFNTVPRLSGFAPHNHPDMIRLCLNTHIYKLSNRFYQHTTATTCTFVLGADLITECKNLFMKYNGNEENSINKVWKRHICISPCCWTLAEHLHLSDLSPVQTLIPPT